MKRYFRFDAPKALEVLLYITGRTHNLYNALKVLYFADKKHLSEYGRLICGEQYIAMRHGAVPSGSYDIVKAARGDGIIQFERLPVNESLQVRDRFNIYPLRKPNMELLSESDVECLDWAITEYGGLSFSELKRRSHEQKDYVAAGEDECISLEDFVKSVTDGDLIWKEELFCLAE